MIEHFFESPSEFKAELPLLYSATAIMLNQKTNGTLTEVNIRTEEINTLNSSLVLGVTEIKRGIPSLGPAYIFLAISLFTAFVTGVFSFATMFTFFAFLLAFMRVDFNYRSFTVKGNHIELTKGFLFFKHHSLQDISLAQLVAIEFFNGEGNDHSVSLTFFEADGSFYEETASVKMEAAQRTSFLQDLKKAYVWVK